MFKGCKVKSMTTEEDTIKQLEIKLSNSLNEASQLVSKKDLDKLNSEIDKRISLFNDSFLEEVKNFSLISVTAAPFSLTLLLSGLEIEKTFLVIAFVFLMVNVLCLNIGVWYLNSHFRKSTFSQKLESIIMDSSVSTLHDEKVENSKRLDALTELVESEDRLVQKKTMEPYNQAKILSLLRDLGIILLSVGIIFLVLSVVWSIFSLGK